MAKKKGPGTKHGSITRIKEQGRKEKQEIKEKRKIERKKNEGVPVNHRRCDECGDIVTSWAIDANNFCRCLKCHNKK